MCYLSHNITTGVSCGEKALLPNMATVSNARRSRLRTVVDCVDKLLRLATARPLCGCHQLSFTWRKFEIPRNVARGLSTAAEPPCVTTKEKCRKNVPLKHIDRSSSVMHVIYRVAQKINPYEVAINRIKSH